MTAEPEPLPPRNPLLERWLESVLFASRWVMAPFYLGLARNISGALETILAALDCGATPHPDR